MKRRVIILLLAMLFVTGYPRVSALFADTIYTNDGREMRGIIVEDYKDRIVMSTVDGEITTLKSDIKQLYYDSEADNLVKLAEQSKERGDMMKAFAYYDMALRADPNSKSAKDGIIFLQGYLFRKEQVKKEDEVRKQEEFENFGAAKIVEEKSGRERVEEMAVTMRKVIGIALSEKSGGQMIDNVRMNSPAEEAGARRGDIIVAIWGRLTGYMPLDEVMKALLEKSSLEIKCTVERDVAVPPDPDRSMMSSLKEMIGATFSMQFDGLTVSDVVENGPALEAGLAKGDIVVAIDNKPTTYMTLKKAVAMMRGTNNSVIMLKIRRELLIWRKI
ncbi:MAG: PDZ domain-containing protein [Candidatus Omnitrophica bacterium]|nr:PDZ domain-containing protein [Candidatus Omnitrophota bacterium]